MKNEMALNAAGGKASPAASPADVLARAAGKVLAPLSRYYSGVLGTKVSARQTLLLVNAQAAFAMAVFPDGGPALLRVACVWWSVSAVLKCRRAGIRTSD